MRVEIAIPPKDIENEAIIREAAIRKSGLKREEVKEVKVVRRSIDARKKPVYRLFVEVSTDISEPEAAILDGYKSVEKAKRVIIVGAGPAGYFAALQLIELGLKPIVLDRGKDVRQRRRDLRAIQQFGEVNPHSNYCFGEGGAGTYSDGKLYTRSHKRGNIKKSLQLLVEHGASTDIMVDSHPHIGSNKLPKIVANIRATIEKYGGEVHFDAFVTDFIIEEKNGERQIKGAITNDKQEYLAEAVILATGHSARDIFKLLHRKNITIEAKPFALGIRIEHPQPLIDKIQYRQQQREDNLPASSYSLVCQVKDRGVFSFCMCPGGLVVPASTAPGEIVVNGMSLSRRDSAFANSGMVTAVELKDIPEFHKFGVFAAMEFQKSVEQTMFKSGDGSQKAPSQRMTDFVKNKLSNSLNDTSYIPGLHSTKVSELLPKFISRRLQDGMRTFGKKMKGYYTETANIIGTESRTSSPVRVPRNKQTYMHEDVLGLFPCGEGAGYAGGILSAAMDGQNVAKAVGKLLE
ncbi:MAG: NAD(P)/FAD-dependent oxidoreductase [Saprospiraceae bacterium]